ncbi:hypothetical protein Tco_1139885 [Tanacetum coccineum]
MLRVLQELSLREKVGITQGNKGLLRVTTAKGKDTCPNNALNQEGNGMTHGLKKKYCWFKLKQVDKFYMRVNLHFWQIQEFQKLKPHRRSLLIMLLIKLIDRLKQTLSEHLKEKESLIQTVSLLKDNFKKEESKNIDRDIALEERIKQLDNIVFKRDQSAQTVHMLMKPQFFYDHTTKQALGFQNPFYLKKAQQLEPKLYVGDIIEKTNQIVIPDSEETL